MTTTSASFRISPLPAAVLDRVRTTGVDTGGTPTERMVATGGEPLRCCLRDALPGEALLLFGYEPPLPPGPYREVGPVFAHAGRCDHVPEPTTYPPDWYGRPQILRAYDSRGWIHPATRQHDGSDPVAAIADVLAVPEVAQVHSRNVAYGCYMFTITRND